VHPKAVLKQEKRKSAPQLYLDTHFSDSEGIHDSALSGVVKSAASPRGLEKSLALIMTPLWHASRILQA